MLEIPLLTDLYACAAIYQKMDTSVGLSTIASLSLGLSMSMTGSGREVICRNLGAAIATLPRPTDDQRTPGGGGGDVSRLLPSLPQPPRSAVVGGALQAGFAGPQRRTSFVGILHQMSAQNRMLFSQQDAAARRLSTGDVDRDSGTTDPPTTATDAAPPATVDSNSQLGDSQCRCQFFTVATSRHIKAVASIFLERLPFKNPQTHS